MDVKLLVFGSVHSAVPKNVRITNKDELLVKWYYRQGLRVGLNLPRLQ